MYTGSGPPSHNIRELPPKSMSPVNHPTAVTHQEAFARDLSGRSDSSIPGDISALGVLNALLRHRVVILVLTLGVSAAFVGAAALRPRRFTSTSAFVPEVRRVNTNLSGIASQFGLTIPGQGGTESPEFYVDLLRSRGILEATVNTRYSFPTDSGLVSTTLVGVYQPHERTAALNAEEAMKRLNRSLRTSVSAKTTVVTLSVSAPNAVLAKAVAARLIDLLGAFNLGQRQSRARAERRFAEGRLDNAKRELRVAEDRLQAFLQANREFRNAPALVFEQERLQSDANILRQLVGNLQTAVEQARMDEVRDTPVITVVQAPNTPVEADSRGFVKLGILGAVLGLAIGMAVAWISGAARAPGTTHSAEFQEFLALRHQALTDLLHPWRAVKRRRIARSA